jgi:hypothetical protein
VPSTWFAAFVRVAAGDASAAAWVASAAALLLTVACVPLAAGRLSLDYARRVGEMSVAAEPPGRRRSFRLPGFSRGEARAVALLVRAQFRFDTRFRMGILSIIPLTGFYVLLGLEDGALADPFLGSVGGAGVYFAIIFIPMTLHTALAASESWRAAWIFFAAPVSHARIVVAAKNFVTVYFLGTYVIALAAFWSWFFDRVWHAACTRSFSARWRICCCSWRDRAAGAAVCRRAAEGQAVGLDVRPVHRRRHPGGRVSAPADLHLPQRDRYRRHHRAARVRHGRRRVRAAPARGRGRLGRWSLGAERIKLPQLRNSTTPQ